MGYQQRRHPHDLRLAKHMGDHDRIEAGRKIFWHCRLPLTHGLLKGIEFL
jgi:hypothetical protein